MTSISSSRPHVAVFDFDGTLTKRDTFIDFIMRTRGKSAVALAFARAMPWLVKWKIGLGSGGQTKEKIFGYLYRGVSADEFARMSREFVRQINRNLNNSAMECLDRHLSKGHSVYIVSASLEPWVSAWAREYDGRIKVIATLPEVDSRGNLTGKFNGKNVRGSEKVARLSAALPRRSEYFMEAYGDSAGDIQMLAFADVAHKVKGSE